MNEDELFEKIINEFKTALKRFGTYTFQDKGAREIMDLHFIIRDLKIVGPQATLNILKRLSIYKNKNTYQLASELASSLQNWKELSELEDELLNELLE